MEEDDTLTKLQGLQADLVAFSESRLANLERLWIELEGSIADFRKLLDKQQKNDTSRQALRADTIKIDDVDYRINAEFREDVIQVADELDLDEVEAAKLYLQSQDTAIEIDRPASLAAVFRFHGYRQTLLHTLRLAIQQTSDLDLEPEHRQIFSELARLITQGEQPDSTRQYFQKCVNAMGDIEEWIRKIQTRLQSASVIGQTAMGYAKEALDFEQESLLKQHESLGAILSVLVKDGHARVQDYQYLLTKTAALDRVDNLVLHYVPVLVSLASAFGPVDSTTTLTEARGLDQSFSDTTGNCRWRLPGFRAAASVFWMAEYSSRYIENPVDESLRHVNLQAEAEARSKRFMDAIQNGALEFVLLLCSQVRAEEWHDPAKVDLLNLLLSGAEEPQNGPLRASDYFQELLSQNLQLFIDAFISNMPDIIRRLKFEEDEQRRNMVTRAPHGAPEYSLHLERFLLIISYAFQGFPEAAQSFWSDPDGNLYGFLQWASKRQSTPRAAAFCEMFRSIAEDRECADAAHKFLLEDATTTAARLRRGAPLSWAQVFNELSFYAPGPDEKNTEMTALVVEPESELMLECYLRLVTHMCRTSENARMFILTNTTMSLHEVLLELASGKKIATRLRACIYSTLAAILTDKLSEVGNALWDAVDGWVHDMPAISQKQGGIQKVQVPLNPLVHGKARLESIAMGFDEPNAFTRLLQALVSPPAEQTALGDLLPFSEQLGVHYRMSGIEEYVDFALDRVFARKMLELNETNQVWELRCTCLDFIYTCLSTFNEDLVIFANSTNLPVDSAISTSSLDAYVRLHPFARVMEWLFNDGVAASLFAAAHEDTTVVADTVPGSPRVLALCRSIQVMDLVLKLQSTYFDIVRPIVKSKSQGRERTIANPALASFEDVILNHVNIFVDLGLYCGTGHQDLTMLSLQLLQSLATARKLSISSGAAHAGSRVLAALQQDYDVDRIALAFIAPLQLDPRELEVAEIGPGIAIKQGILDLVHSSLELSSNKPTLAHCLLGFRCGERTISIPPEGLFSKGASLFHAIAKLAADTIGLEQSNSFAWLSAIRRTACQILHKLVRSPLTERIALDSLRESGYTDAVAITQQSIGPDTLWSGRTCADPEFLLSDSAPIFRDFLIQRAAFFEHASLEIRSTVQRNSPTLRQMIVSSLLGVTSISSGEQVQNASIFGMFDFIDLEIALPFQMSERKFVEGMDFSVCKTSNPKRGAVYDLKLVKEILLLKEAELRKNMQLVDPAASQQCAAEIDAVMLCLQSENQYAAVLAAQRSALNAWVQLVALMLAMGDFDPAPKTALVLQALQIVLPKLDKTLVEDSPVTLPLARLTYNLVRSADTSAAASTRDGNATNDRLAHAFRTSLKGISSATGTSDLRETCYQILRHFLKMVVVPAGGLSNMQRQSAKMIETGGERLIDTVCEDALSSQGTCRTSALLAIEAIIQLFQSTKSSYVIRSLSRLNFISVVVDGIRGIAIEFQEQKSGQDLPTLLSYVHTGLAVLLRTSQSADGATAMLESGLFSAIRDSQLFATDPDIGLEVDNAEALENFYRLLTSLLRVIVSVVVTKGSRNQQIIAQARQFLNENRQCMQGVFKAANRGEKLSIKGREALGELVDGFTVLISASGFLEVDEQPIGQRTIGQMFT